MSAELITQALAARTVADVNALEHALERVLGGGEVRFLCDRQTNWSALSSPVDPQSVIFERVTNAWDAIIEQAAEAVPHTQRAWASPAEAARALLGVPAGGPEAMSNDARSEVATRTLIQVLDADESLHGPTLGFRDWGHRADA
jgi:hypothetical protein